MSLAIRCLAEPRRTLAFGSISGSYAAVGSPFVHPARIVLFQNQTDSTIVFSLDGVNDHFSLLTNTSFVLDVSSNKDANGNGFYIAANTTIYVSGSPGTGQVEVGVFYGGNS